MVFILGSGHSDPKNVGSQVKGKVLFQVFMGPGLWIGSSAEALRNFVPIDAAPSIVKDGLYLTPADGITQIEWSGPMYIFHPTAETSTVAVAINFMGCV